MLDFFEADVPDVPDVEAVSPYLGSQRRQKFALSSDSDHTGMPL